MPSDGIVVSSSLARRTNKGTPKGVPLLARIGNWGERIVRALSLLYALTFPSISFLRIRDLIPMRIFLKNREKIVRHGSGATPQKGEK